MSSNNIDYFNDNFETIDTLGEPDDIIIFDSIEYEMLNLNDVEVILDSVHIKYNPHTMTHQELKDYHIKLALNKKKYIKKYQQTDKGKAKIKIASKKYYDKNRAKILLKKKQNYLEKNKK